MSALDTTLLPSLLLYLDPGTGSMLFSAVVGFAAASFFALKGLIVRAPTQLRAWFGRHAGGAAPDRRLVVYSEGGQYAGTFRPLLQELARRGIGCLYLSSDAGDPLLQSGIAGVVTRHIGRGPAAWAQLNTLHAEVCIMTTPGLDVLQIKRSRHVRHYAHLIHSPTDKAFNRPYSFDYFDSVILCGPHQERTLRCLEQLRGQPPKLLVQAGCLYYDEMLPAYRELPPVQHSAKAPLHVLIAPTWGKNGLLTRYGMRVIRPLVEAGLRVTVRPHPQSWISEAALLADLREQTREFAELRWDDSRDALHAMAQSHLMVSDISGVLFDYCFLTEKPVLSLAFEPERRGFEANDLPYDPWELTVLDIVGKKVGEGDLPRLASLAADMAGDVSRTAQIRALREQYVLNFGQAAVPVVEALEDILQLAAAGGPRALAASPA